MTPAAKRRLSCGALAIGGAVVAWLALAVAWPASALAHDVGLSRGEYTIDGATVTAELTFAQREMAELVPELDADHDEALSAAELQRHAMALTHAVVERILVEGDGEPCPGKLVSARLVEGDGVHLSLTFTCAAVPSEVRFDLALLEELPYGHRHLFSSGKGTALTESILYRKRRSIEVLSQPASTTPGASAAPKENPSGAPNPGPIPAPHPEATGTPDLSGTGRGSAFADPSNRGQASAFAALFKLGIEHILRGVDHLVFLFGLVLVGGRWRSILLVVTAFTVAHSITLGLAVLGVWAPSPRFVEPAIALSIAYVGVENFFVKDAEKRWRITFPFGLLHGFGFAGALQEIALPRASIPGALLAFNLGVEAGQLAVLAAVLPLMALARQREWLQASRSNIPFNVANGLIALAGAGWFIERLAGL